MAEFNQTLIETGQIDVGYGAALLLSMMVECAQCPIGMFLLVSHKLLSHTMQISP